MNVDILDWADGHEETQKISPYKLPAQPPLSSRTSQSTNTVLQQLIQISYDGEQGFLHAAHHVHDRGLRDELHKFARERRSITHELSYFLEEHGYEPSPLQSSTRAALHRTWMNVRTYLTEHDDQSILDEVERGEDEASNAFRSALTQVPGLTASAHTLTGTAYQKIQRAHERIRSLRDSGIYQHTAA